jgi:Uma2 family endonuclease
MMTIATPGPTTDDFVYELSRAIPEYGFERDEDGQLIVSPNHTDAGAKSGEAYYQIRRWQDETGIGGRAFDSSAGFRLSTGALRAPDAAWISEERMSALTVEHRSRFWQVCPDVAIEVASLSDTWSEVKEKVERYLAAGARYAAAIDPQTGDVYELGVVPDRLQLDFRSIADA